MIRVGRQKAILRRGVWLAANPTLESQLNSRMSSWISQTGGPPLHDPDHEATAAREMARQLGGRVLTKVPSPGSRATYIRLRQLQLDFPNPVPGRASGARRKNPTR
jgi:hypothetical protein